MLGFVAIKRWHDKKLVQEISGNNLVLAGGKHIVPAKLIQEYANPITDDWIVPASSANSLLLFGNSSVATDESQTYIQGSLFADISYQGTTPVGWTTVTPTVSHGLTATPPTYTYTLSWIFTGMTKAVDGPIQEIAVAGVSNPVTVPQTRIAIARFLPTPFTIESGDDLTVTWKLEFARI